MTGPQAGDPRIEELLEAVTALRATLRAHDERHSYTERRLGELDQYSREQAAVLAELAPQIDELAAATAPGPPDRDGAGPVVWARLSAQEAAAAWDELARWMDTIAIPTLAPTCRQIPPCWPMHPRVHSAISRASSGSSVGIRAAQRHPTIRREYTSETNAVNTVPDHVGT